MEALVINVDGASKGNPGAAGIGVVVSDTEGNILREIGEYIGKTTNNVAEYTALLRGLEEAVALGASSVKVFTDSELLARQVCGVYKVKAPHLQQLNEAAKALLCKFRKASITHVRREHNAAADKLASAAANGKQMKSDSVETFFAEKPDKTEEDEGQGTLF